MRCPSCGTDDDKVIDSRAIEAGASIRRRRECLRCETRFTTFERIEEVPLMVAKRSGVTEPFRRDKLLAGIASAAKNRLGETDVEAIVTEIEESARLAGPEIASQDIGQQVLERLRAADEVAYLRFASVHKGFDGADDFRREVGLLTGAPPASSDPAPPSRRG